MSGVISRERLTIQKLVKSGEVPPADFEAYQLWLYQGMVITETEAIRAIADYRRNREPVPQEPKVTRIRPRKAGDA